MSAQLNTKIHKEIKALDETVLDHFSFKTLVQISWSQPIRRN